MKALNPPNLVKLFDVIDTEETLFLIMEHVSRGNIFDHLQDHSCMMKNEAQGNFQQLVSTVQYCHQKDVVHRVLKPGL